MPLRSALNDVINYSHANAWETFDWIRYQAVVNGFIKDAGRWKTPGEPAFVSNLLEQPFTQHRLADVIEEHLAPRGLSNGRPLVSGVFIHQKPKVTFGKSKSQLELGDLLLVRQHFQSGVQLPQGRAFLMQAKAAGLPDTGNITRPKELRQFTLYSDWSTPFKFPNGELGLPPSGMHWNFDSGPYKAFLASSGIYGVVANTRPVDLSPRFPDNCSWGIGAATPTIAGSPAVVDASGLSLAAALEGLLLGRWGRPWDSQPLLSDHWSTFVSRCLEKAASWPSYPIQRLGATALPRLRVAFDTAFDGNSSLLAQAGLHTQFPVDSSYVDYLTGKWRSSFSTAAKKWMATVDRKLDSDIPSTGSDAIYIPPSIDSWMGNSPPGGVSVLYVVTSGDKGLDDPASSE